MTARRPVAVAAAVLLLTGFAASAIAQNGAPYKLDDDFFIRQQQSGEAGGGVTKYEAFNLNEGIRIIDGNPVFLPEVVKIEFTTGGFCSGVAVAPDRVLTAGHCGCESRDSYVVRFPNEVLGNGRYGFKDAHLLAEDPVLFPGYDCTNASSAQPGLDLAILYLARSNLDKSVPVDTPPVAPMAYPFQAGARQVFIAGYGRTERGDYPRGLLGAFSKIEDPFCVRGFAFGSNCAMFREFVLSDTINSAVLGIDSCDGDSGGPVYWFGAAKKADGGEDINRFLIGITSRELAGVPQFGATGCGGGGIYTAIGQVDVLAWLSQNGAPVEVGLKARHFAKKTFSPIFNPQE